MRSDVRIKATSQFVISNYNTDPGNLLDYCTDYVIYEQSDDAAMKALVNEKYDNVVNVPNPGHSLSNFFNHFEANWEALPPTVMLLKSNVIGRHVTQDFFDRVYLNTYYTFLYKDPAYNHVPGITSLLYDSAFLERNNSWYADNRPHRYFADFNEFLRFVFVDPVIPQWVLFSPGACYILPRDQITRYPASVYRCLRHLGEYQHFPSEAYFIERALHILFAGSYELQPHMFDFDAFLERLDALPDRTADRLPRRTPRDRLTSFAVRTLLRS